MNLQDVIASDDSLLKVKKLLSKRPVTVQDAAAELKVSHRQIKRAIQQLKTKGLNFSKIGDKVFLNTLVSQGGRIEITAKDRGDGWVVFGFVTDTHLANKHQRLDVLNAAYDEFKEEGITEVFHAGNMIDGEARFNRQELIVAGMDAQLEYFLENYPEVKGIKTYYVTGDDHEGWYSQRECINIGEYLEMRAHKGGRTDLHFMGHVEADVVLKGLGGTKVMRVMHPGGGSAYALSYAPQKLVESFQGGEKPQVLLIGHYHKFDVCFPREVHCISGGCMVDQTMFMRKNKIAAHVGYSIIRIKQDKYDGHITKLDVGWRPFYDRGYYERRFG